MRVRVLSPIRSGRSLAIEFGDLGETKERLRGLRAERERVAGELARTHRTLPSLDALKPRLLEMLREIEKTLRADPKLGRLALEALLGGSRIRVYRDGRIDGV